MTQAARDAIRRTPYGDVVLGRFDEVLKLPGRYLNDHCLIRKDGVWHLFGIVGDVLPRSAAGSNETSFAHATSIDLRNWDVHPDVLTCSRVWPEVRHVYAPHVTEHDGLFYMLYCAPDAQTTQRICLATSGDLFAWERYAGNPVIVPSLSWSRWPGFGLDAPDDGSFGGCRDAHVIRLPDNRFVAYWVSRLQEKFGRNLVCVAASISGDLVHWQEVGPVFSIQAWHRPLTLEVESPCVVSRDGRYWMFFKHGWWTYFTVSESPLDFRGCEPVRLGYAHAAEVFEWGGQWWITHCKTAPDDFMCATSDNTRGLFLGRLDWPDGEHPAFAGRAGHAAAPRYSGTTSRMR